MPTEPSSTVWTEGRLREKLNPHLVGVLPPMSEARVYESDAIDLLSFRRFDILAKFIFADAYLQGRADGWATRLYRDHLEVFNAFEESDGSGKKGFDAFRDTFCELIDSVSADGLDPEKSIVPVSRDGVPLDGSHRVAAALATGRPVTVARFDVSSPSYDAAYFLGRGLSQRWADAMAHRYCVLKPGTYVATLFPAAGDRKPAEEALRGECSIVYRKECNLAGEGAFNLTRQLYPEEPWVGSHKNGFAGARRKAASCFPTDGTTYAYLLEADSLETVLRAKEAVRKVCRVSNHSIHTSDTHPESVRLAQMLFNSNGIHALNNARLQSYGWFYRLLDVYRKALFERAKLPEEHCIDSSSVMAIYGIREARDIDYLHAGPDELTGVDTYIGSHNEDCPYYADPVPEIVLNPEMHFYFHDVKFTSLDVLSRMKQKRGEAKDVRDCESIASVLSSQWPAEHEKDEKRRAVLRRRYYWYMRTRHFLGVDRTAMAVFAFLKKRGWR